MIKLDHKRYKLSLLYTKITLSIINNTTIKYYNKQQYEDYAIRRGEFNL